MVWYLVVLMLYFKPDGPTIIRLWTESEDDVSFMLCSNALCQEWVCVLSQCGMSVTMRERQDSTTPDHGIGIMSAPSHQHQSATIPLSSCNKFIVLLHHTKYQSANITCHAVIQQ